MKHGTNCLLVSGVVLMVMGIACIAAAMGAASLIDDSLKTTCAKVSKAGTCMGGSCKKQCDDVFPLDKQKGQKNQCYEGCKASVPTGQALQNQCEVDIRVSAGCTCPDPAKMQVTAKDCNCDGTPLGLINQYWTMACLGLGLIGFIGAFLITGVPALFAALRSNRCTACCKNGSTCCNNNAVCYGVFAGLFCPLFLLMGALFLLIGAATQSPEFDKVCLLLYMTLYVPVQNTCKNACACEY
jgi:hypothetical protein